jgi:hypothetical protein
MCSHGIAVWYGMPCNGTADTPEFPPVKKWFIVLLALLAVSAAIAAVAGYSLNARFGWIAAAEVSHESAATSDTRLRIKLDALRLGQDLQTYLPANLPLPAWLPWDLPQLLPRVLPREVALLGGTDFRDGAYKLILFINEQRGGPALPNILNTQTQFRQSVPAIAWDEAGFTLEKRGMLTARGQLALPDTLEETIRETWSSSPPPDTLALPGGHLVEGVVDNRNGEMVSIIAAFAPVWNTSFAQLERNPQFIAVLALLADVHDLQMTVDFENPDTLLLQVRVTANPAGGRQLEVFIPLMLPMITQQFQRNYGLVLETEAEWKEPEETYKLDARIFGMEDKLKTYLAQFATAPPPAT